MDCVARELHQEIALVAGDVGAIERLQAREVANGIEVGAQIGAQRGIVRGAANDDGLAGLAGM
jgi:hypothetical protein